MRPSRHTPWRLASVALAATGLLLAACGESGSPAGQPAGGGAPRQPPPTPVLVAAAEVRSLGAEFSTVGSLRSPETTTVSAEISGVIVQLETPEGREVRKGQLLARLDEASVRAAMRVAEARERNAKIALDRAQPLVRDGVVPAQRLDDAEAELETAQGLLEEATTRLGKAEIRAPFTGRVGIQTAQLGQYVSSGDPIMELTLIDPLELVFGVPEEQASTVRIGQQVRARVGRCGQPFAAVVEALDPKIDPGSRTLSVQALVANRDRLLIPGMSARVRLQVGDLQPTLVVPREALVSQGNRYQVWVVDGDGVAAPRAVVPGTYLPDVVGISSGLEEGETVVVAGHQKLRPGSSVSQSPWAPTDNQNLALGANSDDCPDDE